MPRFLALIFFALLISTLTAQDHKTAPSGKKSVDSPKVSADAQKGLDCHNGTTPGVVAQWKDSAHAKSNVDCFSCHKANANDPAAFDHYGQKIAVIVTPNYCARCHENEVKQFEASHHAKAAKFIGSLDNMLGEIIEGGPAAENGCRQ